MAVVLGADSAGEAVAAVGDRAPGAQDGERHERAIGSLCDSEDAPLAEVQDLFATELARLGTDARVRRYLTVLATRNVRAVLRLRASSRPRRVSRAH